MSQYPTQAELLSYLTTLAGITGDPTQVPFRVDIIPAHGKPPMYSVMIKSPYKDRLRQQTNEAISRGSLVFRLWRWETSSSGVTHG